MSGWTRAPERLAFCLAVLVVLASCASIGPVPANGGQGSLYSVTLPKSDGSRLHFNQFRDQVVMVDFFTTWGPTAVINTADYQKLYERYQQRGLMVVGVVLDDLGPRVLTPFAQGAGISYPLVAADQKIKDGESFFGTIGATPLLMIFDRDGQLVKVFVGHVPISSIEKVIKQALR